MMENILKLHEAIAVILLSKENRTATTQEISDEIATRGLYFQIKTGDIAPPSQIRARTDPSTHTGNHYAYLFKFIKPNIVQLT